MWASCSRRRSCTVCCEDAPRGPTLEQPTSPPSILSPPLRGHYAVYTKSEGTLEVLSVHLYREAALRCVPCESFSLPLLVFGTFCGSKIVDSPELTSKINAAANNRRRAPRTKQAPLSSISSPSARWEHVHPLGARGGFITPAISQLSYSNFLHYIDVV